MSTPRVAKPCQAKLLSKKIALALSLLLSRHGDSYQCFPFGRLTLKSLLTLLLLYEVCVLKGCAKQTTAIITHKSAMLLWLQLCQKVAVTLTHESVIKIVTAELRNNIENSKP